MTKKRPARTSQALRDALFNELEELQSGEGDPARALAVARLAQQIVSTARVEMEFLRMAASAMEKGTAVTMGTMQLGSDSSDAASAKPNATEH